MGIWSNAKNALISFRDNVSKTVLDSYKKFVPNLTYAGENKNSIIVNKLDVRPVNRGSNDIQRWRTALLTAESVGQQRTMIYDIYSEILLDGYLSEGLLGKRTKAICNKQLIFQKHDGTTVDELKDISQKTIFGDLLKHIIESRFWGFSLIELTWKKDGTAIRNDRKADIRVFELDYRVVVFFSQSDWKANGGPFIHWRELPGAPALPGFCIYPA